MSGLPRFRTVDLWYEGSRIGLVTDDDLYLIRLPCGFPADSICFEFDEEGLDVTDTPQFPPKPKPEPAPKRRYRKRRVVVRAAGNQWVVSIDGKPPVLTTPDRAVATQRASVLAQQKGLKTVVELP